MVLGAMFAMGLGAQPAPAQDSTPTVEILPVLGKFLSLWEAEDHSSLAGLIHEAGASITLAPGGRSTHSTSPAQAHYLFKSLFQQTDRHHLEVETVLSGKADDSVRAVLLWGYRRGDQALRERVFIGLERWGEGWRIVTLRTGR